MPPQGNDEGFRVEETRGKRIADLGQSAPAPWQAPAEELTIYIDRGGMVLTSGTSNLLRVNCPELWQANSESLASPIEATLRALDRFRVEADESLNAIDADGLEDRLSRYVPENNWSIIERQADLSAYAETMASGGALHRLADAGYRLYQAVFPKDTTLRKSIDNLAPGALLRITWNKPTSVWWLAVPWALMYRSPPQPGKIDAMQFLGLRFRIEHICRPIEQISSYLGTESDAGHLLYWGEEPGEAAAIEAHRQRVELSKLGRHQTVLPDLTKKEERSQLIDFVKSLPPDVKLLYFFCHCRAITHEDATLRFASINGDVEFWRMGSDEFVGKPLLFMNACGSAANLEPYYLNEVRETFLDRKCRGFIGTESKVPTVFASRFAEVFFHFFYGVGIVPAASAGEAVAQARLFFLREYSNLGGLFYSYWNDYGVRAADDPTQQS